MQTSLMVSSPEILTSGMYGGSLRLKEGAHYLKDWLLSALTSGALPLFLQGPALSLSHSLPHLTFIKFLLYANQTLMWRAE